MADVPDVSAFVVKASLAFQNEVNRSIAAFGVYPPPFQPPVAPLAGLLTVSKPPVAPPTPIPASITPTTPLRPPRKPTLAAALRQAKRAGVSVRGATIEAGKITLELGEPGSASDNPWDIAAAEIRKKQ